MPTLRNIGLRTLHLKEGSLPKGQSMSLSADRAKKLMAMYGQELVETKDDPTLKAATEPKAAPAKGGKEKAAPPAKADGAPDPSPAAPAAAS